MSLVRRTWQPPPDWPPAPPGWSPPPGWQPDPSWPEPPEDWQFWQRAPRSRRWWVGLAAIVLLGGGLAGMFVFGLYVYTTGDNPEFLDDQVSVRAEAACAHLDTALRSLPPLPSTATDRARAARLDDQVVLMRALVTDMRGLPASVLRHDDPAEGWLRDWEALADARSQYADQLKLGTSGATMHEPQTSDGFPISGRMKDASTDSCYRPIDELRQPLP